MRQRKRRYRERDRRSWHACRERANSVDICRSKACLSEGALWSLVSSPIATVLLCWRGSPAQKRLPGYCSLTSGVGCSRLHAGSKSEPGCKYTRPKNTTNIVSNRYRAPVGRWTRGRAQRQYNGGIHGNRKSITSPGICVARQVAGPGRARSESLTHVRGGLHRSAVASMTVCRSFTLAGGAVDVVGGFSSHGCVGGEDGMNLKKGLPQRGR